MAELRVIGLELTNEAVITAPAPTQCEANFNGDQSKTVKVMVFVTIKGFLEFVI